MSLYNKIKEDQLQARKSGLTAPAKLLTTLLGESNPYGRDGVSDDDVTKTLLKFKKNLEETIKAQDQRGVDTASTKQELEIIKLYLPKEMSEDDIEDTLNKWKVTADNPNIGSAMKYIKQYSSDQGLIVNGKLASQVAKRIL